MRTGLGDELVEVYSPAWWRVDRWVKWLLVPREARRVVEMCLRDSSGKARYMVLRARSLTWQRKTK